MSDGEFSVNFDSGVQYNLDEVRARQEAFMPDGEHAWVINVVYAIEDPDSSQDDMVLDGENFVGVTAIHCLLCHAEYDPAIRHYKCAQALPTP